MSATVLITGASRGLGLEITKQQLTAGNTVIALSRQVSAPLQELCEVYPDRISHVACDLADPEAELAQRFATDIPNSQPIHGFVSNAAVAYDDLVTNLQLKELESMMRANMVAPMLLTKLVLRRMLLHEVAGSIVHISSVCAHTGYKGLAMYGASKGAMEAFSKNVAREWGPKGIRSNCVVPGFMETAMSESLSAEQKQRIYRRTALGQRTELKSVAETVGFLLSEAAGSITGQNIHVDAGTI